MLQRNDYGDDLDEGMQCIQGALVAVLATITLLCLIVMVWRLARG